MTPTNADPDRSTGCPAGFAGRLLWVATLLLPRGVNRNRYRREFAAELYDRPRIRQLIYALHVCVNVWSLRAVLIHGTDIARRPVLCKTHLHHHWQKQANDLGLPFQTCARCGQEREGPLPSSLFSPMHVGGLNH